MLTMRRCSSRSINIFRPRKHRCCVEGVGSHFANGNDSRPLLRQSERKVLARVAVAAGNGADRHHDVLLAVQHVRHRGTALWRRYVDGTGFFALALVVPPQHRATRMFWRLSDLWVA